MVSLYITVIAYLSSKNERLSLPDSLPTARPQIAGPLVSDVFGGADRFAAMELLYKATDANKDQQLRANADGFRGNKDQQRSTEINKTGPSHQ